MVGRGRHDAATWQSRLDEKAQEAERIRGEIQKAKLDALMLRQMLLTQGISDESLIPAEMGTGSAVLASDLTWSEHKRLIEWLAENINMASKETFNVSEPEVIVAGHRALLGRMSQWRLNVAGDLKLSAPEASEWELTAILSKTRSQRLTAQELDEFAENWLLVTTELIAEGVATPALFLIHKESERAIVVSSWPNVTIQPLPAALCPTFDPCAFFGRAAEAAPQPVQPQDVPQAPRDAAEVSFVGRDGYRSKVFCSESVGMKWFVDCGDGHWRCENVEDLGVSFDIHDQFTLTGPLGFAVIAEPLPGPAQRLLVSNLVAMALEHGVRVQRSSSPLADQPARPRSMSSGDCVEVKYQGAWLRGVLCALHGEVAHVNCEVDEGDVITVAPLDSVRLADFSSDVHETQCEQQTDTCGRC